METDREYTGQEKKGSFTVNGALAEMFFDHDSERYFWRCPDNPHLEEELNQRFVVNSGHPDSPGWPMFGEAIAWLLKQGHTVDQVDAPERESLGDDEILRNGNPIY